MSCVLLLSLLVFTNVPSLSMTAVRYHHLVTLYKLEKTGLFIPRGSPQSTKASLLLFCRRFCVAFGLWLSFTILFCFSAED